VHAGFRRKTCRKGDLGKSGRIIFKNGFSTQDGGLRSEFIWFKVGTRDTLL
jgi:hypothetical protein